MRRRPANHLMLAALGLLWLPAAAVFWNAVAPWQWKPKQLVGVQVGQPAAPLSPEAFADRSFQESQSKAIGPSIPFFADVVRLHNQVLYSVFGLSPSHHILIGTDGFLLNPAYTQAYCNRDLAAAAPAFRTWAETLRDIQKLTEARGQTFLYVLTPSKIEHLPGALPAGFPCASAHRHRFVATAISQLKAAGVQYVDATAEIDRIKQTYGYEPFTPYGIHWTGLAAYPATRAIIDAINEAKGRQAIIPYEIAVSRAKRPVTDDYDYSSLLNVVWTPKPKDTAAFTVDTPTPPTCPARTSILTVGGSFFVALGRNLSLAPCPPSVAQLFYLTLRTYHFEKGHLRVAGQPDYDLLPPADVLIVEENVGVVLKTQHIAALLTYLRTGRLPEGGVH